MVLFGILNESTAFPLMRVIEQAMIAAIRYQKDWQKDNTAVEIIHHGVHGTPSYDKEIVVKLYGHKIARIFPINRRAILSSCGHQTKTTKSRLNAILSGLNYRGGVYQSNWDWYLGDKDFTDNMEISF